MRKVLSLVLVSTLIATQAFGAGITKREASSTDASSSVLWGSPDTGDTIKRIRTDSLGRIEANITGEATLDSLTVTGANASSLEISEVELGGGAAYAQQLAGTNVGLTEGIAIKGLAAIVHDEANNPSLMFINEALTLNQSLSYDIANSTFLFSDKLTVEQNSDTVEISHDGTDAFMKWSDGYCYLMTDEGTNTDSRLYVKGKGTGSAYIAVSDGSNANYNTFLGQVDSVGQIIFSSSVTEFAINEGGADVNFRVESDTVTHAIALDAGTNAVTLSAPNSATTPAANATLSFWIDETSHALKVAVKYADGTAKTATVAFD